MSKNQIKFVKSLQQKKFRQLHGVFVVEGRKMVDEAIASDFEVEQLFTTPEHAARFPDSHSISGKEMQMISTFKTAPGVLVVVKIPEQQSPSTTAIHLVLDDIKDPGNMGTLLRTAAWFGVEQVLLTPNCVDVFNPKTVQATMGGLFYTRVCRCNEKEILEFLKKENCAIFAADMHGTNSAEAIWEFPLALIVGSESHGVGETFRKHAQAVHIEKVGKGESLNAATAGAILLSKISEKHRS